MNLFFNSFFYCFYMCFFFFFFSNSLSNNYWSDVPMQCWDLWVHMYVHTYIHICYVEKTFQKLFTFHVFLLSFFFEHGILFTEIIFTNNKLQLVTRIFTKSLFVYNFLFFFSINLEILLKSVRKNFP